MKNEDEYQDEYQYQRQDDPYDILVDMALIDGKRIAPLFRVFCVPDGRWRVCGTDAIGDPQFTHSEHDGLGEALVEANEQNKMAGLQPRTQDAFSVCPAKPSGPRTLRQYLFSWFSRRI